MTTKINRRRLLFSSAAGVGLAAMPAFAGPALAAGRTTAVLDSKIAPGTFVPLDGARNTRDLGGYTTTDGKRIKGGKVFRTGNLVGLTATGVSQLNGLGVKWSFDLRDDAERYLLGKCKVGAAKPWLAPIGNDVEDNPYGPPVAGQVTASTIAEFQSYVTFASSVISVGSIARMLALQGGMPLIYNCDSGASRSGWTTAVLMTVLGVPRAQVNSEFLLSNSVLGGQYLFTNYLDAAFNKVNEIYGDWATFVQIGLGLDAADITVLKSNLLN
jgi:protein-tyrosine phosphatase